jgi:hypothetical protein
MIVFIRQPSAINPEQLSSLQVEEVATQVEASAAHTPHIPHVHQHLRLCI